MYITVPNKQNKLGTHVRNLYSSFIALGRSKFERGNLRIAEMRRMQKTFYRLMQYNLQAVRKFKNIVEEIPHQPNFIN